MKIRLIAGALFLVASTLFISCNNAEPKGKGNANIEQPTPANENTFSITPTEATMHPRDVISLNLTLPKGESPSNVIFSSSNTKIATVTPKGEVRAIRIGEVTITARLAEQTATCKITVTEREAMIQTHGEPYNMSLNTFIEKVWDFKQFPDQFVGKLDKPAVIDFWAPWCHNCTDMDPYIEKLAADYEDRAYVIKINVGGSEKFFPEYEIYKAMVKVGVGHHIKKGEVVLPMYALLPVDGSNKVDVLTGATQTNIVAMRKFFDKQLEVK